MFPSTTRFRKPQREEGVDLEYDFEGTWSKLQITTAYPTKGESGSGGYQFRLLMEKLTNDGQAVGSGLLERKGSTILQDERCSTDREEEKACRLGFVEALRGKAHRGSSNVTLLVRAVDFVLPLGCDAECFKAIALSSIETARPNGFASIVVLDHWEGFFVEVSR